MLFQFDMRPESPFPNEVDIGRQRKGESCAKQARAKKTAKAIAERQASSDPRSPEEVVHITLPKATCPGGHTLPPHVADRMGYCCDECKQEDFQVGTVMWSCRVCNYDRCQACHRVSVAVPHMMSGSAENMSDPCVALVWAAGEGHAHVARRLIDAARQTNAEAARGHDTAALAGEPPLLPQLLTTETDGWTAMHMAAFNGHAEVAGLLVKAARVFDFESSRELPLLPRLLTAGRSKGETALHTAAECVHVEVARVLLVAARGHDAAAPTEAPLLPQVVLAATQDKECRMALHEAATVEFAGLLLEAARAFDAYAPAKELPLLPRLLLAKDRDDMTAFRFACSKQRTKVAGLLLEAARSHDAAAPAEEPKLVPQFLANKPYGGPLCSAAFSGHTDVAVLLLEAARAFDADAPAGEPPVLPRFLATEDSFGGNTLTSAASGAALCDGKRPRHAEVAGLLLEAARAFDAAAPAGEPPLLPRLLAAHHSRNGTSLHTTAGSGCAEFVGLLLEAARAFDAEAPSGEPPLLPRLLAAEMDKFTWHTALHCAARCGHAEVAGLLLEAARAFDAAAPAGEPLLPRLLAAKDYDGSTAAQLAAEEGHAELAGLLLEAAEDPQGRSA